MCIHIAQISQPFRLIWVADIVGFAEMFAGQIDWLKIKRDYPRVVNILALFDAVTPLSDSLKEQAKLTMGRPAGAIGAEFEGWPRLSVKAMRNRQKSYPQILQDTLWPPEWWLCLYHGVAPGHGLNRARWLGHPLHIAGFTKQLLFEKK